MPDFDPNIQMPFSMEAEQAVLGSILIDPGCMSTAQVIVRPEHFFLPQHQAIFSAMVELETTGGKIDPLIVLERLKRDEVYDDAGGRNYLFQMAQAVPSMQNLESYAQIVREKFYVRRLIGISQEIIQNASAETESADTLLDSAEQKIYEIRQGRSQAGPSRLRDILVNDVYDHLTKMNSPDKEQFMGFKTGLSELDDALTGFNRADLVLIGARPAMGKTSVALRIAQQIATFSSKKVLFFTLEMTKAQVATRVLSMESLVPGYKFRTGQFDQNEWRQIGDAVGRLNDCELWFDDTSSITVPEIKARARRLKGVDCIVIDYLGLIQGAKRTENRTQEVSEITRSLKMMAKDLNIPVICCAQLSRATEGRGKSHRPQLSDLRESGSIEQDADVVLMLYREEYYKNEKDSPEEVFDLPEADTMEIIIAKNRHGFTKTVEFIWDGEHTLILPKETQRDWIG